MKSQASARWEGNIKQGKGTITTPSGALLKTPYNWGTRFENAAGTSPEELLAAAHAACFSMTLAAELGATQIKPECIYTTATVTLEPQAERLTITGIHLDATVRVPGVDRLAFDRAVNNAKESGPISQLLKKQCSVSVNLVGL